MMTCCVENHEHGDCCTCSDLPLTCDLCSRKAAVDVGGRVRCSEHVPDVVERAKIALAEFDRIGSPNIYTLERHRELTVAFCGFVPQLIAEVEHLRSETESAYQNGWDQGWHTALDGD